MTDVCVVLEGTWPARTGGVSTWLQQLLLGLPDVSFSVVHLHDGPAPRLTHHHPPANVTAMQYVPLGGEPHPRGFAPARQLPDAAVYHGLSSGAAGAVAVQAARDRAGKALITDHGLAWVEARLAGQLESGRVLADPVASAHGLLATARANYATAAAVTTVCAPNLARQRAAGAPPQRSTVIPNGVDVPESAPPTTRRGCLRVGLVGRVVALKDVATFVRAAALVRQQAPATEFTVIGPVDHDPEYSWRCRGLASALGPPGWLRFAGEIPPQVWTQQLDVVVLTSRSEAQPMVVLEAMAAGLPVVATAVGDCPQLLGARPAAGLLTGVRDPVATAAAVLRLLGDPQLRASLGHGGWSRARRAHSLTACHDRYRRLYTRLLEDSH